MSCTRRPGPDIGSPGLALLALVLSALLLMCLILPVTCDDVEDGEDSQGRSFSGSGGSSTSEILRELCSHLKDSDPVLYKQMCYDTNDSG